MVRVFGDGASLLVDREHEVKVTRLMCQYNLAAKIYCSFDNGIPQQFIQPLKRELSHLFRSSCPPSCISLFYHSSVHLLILF